MKKLLVLLWLTPVVILASFLYKAEHKNVFTNFPPGHVKGSQVRLQVVLFFSKASCPECLEVIEVLNSLPGDYDVKGVVPDEEFREITEVRRATHAAFPLFPVRQFRKCEPRFMPAVVCTSMIGTIYAVLPIIPGTKSFFGDYLDRFRLLTDSFNRQIEGSN